MKNSDAPDGYWSPADLLQLSGGYWSTCALHAAIKLDVFSLLATQPATAHTLAEALSADPRALAMLLDALTALGLLEKHSDRYVLTPSSSDFLVRSSPRYLGHIMMHHHHLMSGWTELDEAVRHGGPVGERVSHSDDETVRESFEMGMFNLAMLQPPKIVPFIDLSGRRRLLDMGGGPGTYAIQFCLHNPELSAVVFDLPSTRRFAEATIDQFGLADRVTFVAGDFMSDEMCGNFDVVWLSHILHSEGPQGCAVILKKAISTLQSGGMVLVQEFILDDNCAGPTFPALFSLNMLIGTSHGQSYSESQLKQLLADAGLGNIRRVPLELPNGAGVIVGMVR